MIIDKFENITRYSYLDLIKFYREEQYQKGKFSMQKEGIFGIGLEYVTKAPEEGLWEAHQNYLDVHLILDGEEKVYVSDLRNCKPTMKYDRENDYQLFDGKMENEITLKKGSFLVLFPNEVHKTGVKTQESVQVKKIVFKIEL